MPCGFSRVREVFVFRSLPFIFSSSANWYWGHCLHKPLFPDKLKKKGGEKNRRRWWWQKEEEWRDGERLKVTREQRKTFMKEEKKEKERNPRLSCMPKSLWSAHRPAGQPTTSAAFRAVYRSVRPGKSHQLGRMSCRSR